MCGRYHRTATLPELAAFFQVDVPEDNLAFVPAYNIAPTTTQPIVRQQRDSNRRELVAARWGMIGHKQGPDPTKTTINARRASLMHSDLWLEPFHCRRALIPSDGFYEWRKAIGGNKTTGECWRFTLRTGGLFAFAGLWDAWRNPETNVWIQSFTIITVSPNALLAEVHNRMPAILQPKDYDEWLNCENTEQPPMHLLMPYETTGMAKERASRKVGQVRNQGAELLRADDGIGAPISFAFSGSPVAST